MPFPAALVMALALLVACGSNDDSSNGIRVDVEPIELPGPVEDVEFDGDSVWVQLEEGDPAHVELDRASGEVLTEIDDLIGSQGPHEWGGYLWFLRCFDPYEGLPEIRPNAFSDHEYRQQIVKVDRETLEPVAAISLLDPCRRFEKIVDGVWWDLRHGVDLDTGELIPNTYEEDFIDAALWDGVYWISDRYEVRRSDGRELVQVIEYAGVDFTRRRSLFEELRGVDLRPDDPSLVPYWFGAVKYWDGRYWVSGETRGEPGSAFEFDPETGEILDSAPQEEIPLATIEVDGYRFDFYGEGDWVPSAERDDRTSGWQLIDRESGVPVGEFDFGGFRPLGGGDGSLWLVGPGITVGRVSLDHLVELAGS